jgi:mono/diheme cytochrome c family protein
MSAARLSMLVLSALAAAGPASAANTIMGEQVTQRQNAESKPITSSVRSLYVVHCAGCHGMDGAGAKAANVPDVRRLGNFLRIDGGRAFVISVPGVMGSGLSDQQVADVTNWLLATMAKGSVPEGHQPYDAAEVQRARAVPLVDVAAARSQLAIQARERGVTIDY